MSYRIGTFPAIAMAALFSFASCASAADQMPLERWRSYSGVSWDKPENVQMPAVFSGSVNAPLAGIHFDAKGRAFVSTPRLISASAPATLNILDTDPQSGPARLTAFPSRERNAVDSAPDQNLRNVLGFYVDRKNGWLWALDMGFIAGETESPSGSISTRAERLNVSPWTAWPTVRQVSLMMSLSMRIIVSHTFPTAGRAVRLKTVSA